MPLNLNVYFFLIRQIYLEKGISHKIQGINSVKISEQRILLGTTWSFHKNKGVNLLGATPIIIVYLLT